MTTCTHCSIEFERKHPLQSYCTYKCKEAAKAERRKTGQRASYTVTCPVCLTEFTAQRASRRYCSDSCQDQTRQRSRYENYRMTNEEGDAFRAAGCEVCGSHDDLHIDHDHSCCPGSRTCGKCVRGVLCFRHNIALGMVEDNVDELMALAAYLLEKQNVLTALPK